MGIRKLALREDILQCEFFVTIYNSASAIAQTQVIYPAYKHSCPERRP